jgi:hypothetical protein
MFDSLSFYFSKLTEWKAIQKIESGCPIQRNSKRTLEIYERIL